MTLRNDSPPSSSWLRSDARTDTIEIEHACTQSDRLSCLEPDSPPGSSVIALDLPDGKRQYKLEFSACTNPMCNCRVLDVSLRPAVGQQDAKPVLRITFDPEKALVEAPRDAGALADALTRRFSTDDWPMLYQIFLNLKADCSEVSDIAEVTGKFPEDVLADPAYLLAYKQVFRWSANFKFTWKGSSWTALEGYCTNPDCNCANVLVDFIRFPLTSAAPPKKSRSQDGVLIFLDFRTGAWRVEQEGPSGSPAPEQLVAVFQTNCPDWKNRFERRHRVLRGLHQRAREGSAPPSPAARPALEPRKTGRNERCPCGSGKKYKLCCGR